LDNYAELFGGAIFATGFEDLTISETNFFRNRVSGSGSDIFASFSEAFITIKDSKII